MRYSDKSPKSVSAGADTTGSSKRAHIQCEVQNTLGAVGAQSIAEAVCGHTALVSLRLDFNSIGDDTEKIGDALMHNCALQLLSLQCNGIGPRGVSRIAEGLAGNSCLLSLDLSGNVVQVRDSRTTGTVHQV